MPPVDISRYLPGAITHIGDRYTLKMVRDMMDERAREAKQAEYNRDPLLQEREKTHGDYTVQAGWAQTMKTLLRSTPNWNDKRGAQKESLDMIITKISRILHGAVDTKDHWEDISGYAKLGSENCE